MMRACVLLALCAAAQAAMPWTSSLTRLNSAEFTSLSAVSIGMSTSEWEQPTAGTTFPSSTVVQANQGSYYVDTKNSFNRPVDISVEMYQSSSSPECGVVALFPQTTTRHSGYNAGVGWWGDKFGAGVDGSITNYGNDAGSTSGWQTVRINAAADGNVYFYLGGVLKYTASNNNYQSGIVRFGNNCRNFQYRNFRVIATETPAPTVTPTTLTPTEHPTPTPTPSPTESPTTKPPSPSPSHTPTEPPTPSPTHSPTEHPTEVPSSTVNSCHCIGCHGHYWENAHIQESADSCREKCDQNHEAASGQTCKFALYRDSIQKCYLYNDDQKTAAERHSAHEAYQEFMCYHK